MDWERILDEYGGLIEQRLRSLFQKVVREGEEYHPFMGKVYSTLEEYVLRKGKRLASCSTLIIYEGYKGDLDDRILEVALGVELYRHSILIHDDFVDNDQLRRGGKTFHETHSVDRGDRFGGGIAVFAGNLLYSSALECVLRSGFAAEKLSQVLNQFAKGYHWVNESQMLDLLFEFKEPNVEEWYVMASKRAATLFETSMLTGAILGDAPKEDLALLKEASRKIGYSFDIQDDIIDSYVAREQYGREPGGDLVLNKKPLHVVYALQRADLIQLKRLKELMGKRSLKDLKLVREIFKESDALDLAKRESRIHAEEAKGLLRRTSMSRETIDFFSSLIDYIKESLDWYR